LDSINGNLEYNLDCYLCC